MIEHTQTTVTFTQNAVHKLHTLLSAPDKASSCLRVYIVGGGCSGFQYGFTLDENFSAEEDIILEIKNVQNLEYQNLEKEKEKENEKDGKIIEDKIKEYKTMKVAIDPLSYQYLEGAKIDYLESLQGARFVVENPHAETTCGCGSSFSLKETENEIETVNVK